MSTSEMERIEADSKPEYTQYRDEGCDLYESCLSCPLPRCRHDAQAVGRRPAKMFRDDEVLRQWRLYGTSAAQLAESFGVSRRTVQRIIRRSRSEQHTDVRAQEQPDPSTADSPHGPRSAQGLS